ncbi:nitroreductase [Aliiroseovarius crassostreae]|uniref:nitroreductase n=1 Tax=Aliiroseovarius crassostreae TaxID=154981 RepID=UPI00220C5891|nr:nitroreductase [Aliiroseovarius crassostreae]UWP91445.1 nitroreductase [Aliiroseovarius crassostreae]
MDYDAFNALLSTRHSCRAFLPDPLSDREIAQILTAAQKVPSWCNAQPWQVEITRAEETHRLRAALYDHALHNSHAPDLDWPSAYSGAHQDRRRACGLQLYESVGITRGDRVASGQQMLENFRFFGAPHMALISAPRELGPYAYLDCGGFVTGFALAAQSLGLGSIPQAAVAAFAPFLRDWFGISEERVILCGIAFGRPDPQAPVNQFRTTRAPLGEWVRWHG